MDPRRSRGKTYEELCAEYDETVVVVITVHPDGSIELDDAGCDDLGGERSLEAILGAVNGLVFGYPDLEDEDE